MTKEEQVYEIVRTVPKGKVTSYGKIAKMVGIGSRQVGRILHNNPDGKATPCHRVVRSDRTLALGYAFGGLGEQKSRLEAEGVKFRNNKIVKEHFI